MTKQLFSVVAVLCMWGAFSSTAEADDIDTPAQACQLDVGSPGSWDKDGIRNDSTTSVAYVWCPVTLEPTTGRTLWIGGTDQNGNSHSSTTDFTCYANTIDSSNTYSGMVSLSTAQGVYSTNVVATYSIPDSVVMLNVYCTIPIKTTSSPSKLVDMAVSW